MAQAVIVPFALAIGLIAITLVLASHLNVAERWMEHSSQVLHLAQNMRVHASDSQTDLRGYWLGGLQKIEASYQKNQAEFEEIYGALERLVSDNPEQTGRLRNIHAIFSDWENFVAVAVRDRPISQQREKEVAVFYAENSKFRIRTMAACDAFIDGERLLRSQRLEKTRAVALFLLGMVGALVLMLAPAVAFFARSGILQVSQSYGAALAEAQKAIGARDEFLSIASHELKTPLTLVKLQLQLLERASQRAIGNGSPNGYFSDSIAMALKQTDTLNAQVDDLLDASRIRAGKFAFQRSAVDLSDVIEDVARRFAEQMRIAGCSLELDLQRPIVGFWDPRRIEQIVANLISNAIKYAPNNPIKIGARRHDGRAVFTVQDSGPGIAKEKQQLIFERFERAGATSRAGGLGLGLYIVKNITESKGGKIWVESEVGHGAKFNVELPISPANVGHGVNHPNPSQPPQLNH